MTDTYRFAIVDRHASTIRRILPGWWEAGDPRIPHLYDRPGGHRVVCLDEAPDAPAMVGDRVTVDEEGVGVVEARPGCACTEEECACDGRQHCDCTPGVCPCDECDL